MWLLGKNIFKRGRKMILKDVILKDVKKYDRLCDGSIEYVLELGKDGRDYCFVIDDKNLFPIIEKLILGKLCKISISEDEKRILNIMPNEILTPFNINKLSQDDLKRFDERINKEYGKIYIRGVN